MVAGKSAKNAHTFERAAFEWYVDTPSCAAALFEVQPFDGSIYDPCAGMGNVVRMAARHGYEAHAADLNPQPQFFKTAEGVEFHPEPRDFLKDNGEAAWADNIVFNCPYGDGPKLADDSEGPRLEELFIDRALDVAAEKVAVLLRYSWYVARKEFLEGKGLLRIWALTPRPSMLPGSNIVAGEMPGGGSVDYAWFVFLRGYDGMPTAGHAVREIVDRKAILDQPDHWTWRLGE